MNRASLAVSDFKLELICSGCESVADHPSKPYRISSTDPIRDQ